MATALATNPASQRRAGAAALDVQPAIPAAGRAALTARHPHQIITDIWVRRGAAWRAPAANSVD
jgi:hypothetical protein